MGRLPVDILRAQPGAPLLVLYRRAPGGPILIYKFGGQKIKYSSKIYRPARLADAGPGGLNNRPTTFIRCRNMAKSHYKGALYGNVIMSL